MGICTEKYSLTQPLPDLSSLKDELECASGLEIELEDLKDGVFFIYCDKFSRSIEVNFDKNSLSLSIFYSSSGKKYFEYFVLSVLSKYFENIDRIPLYANKKWCELNYVERFFRG